MPFVGSAGAYNRFCTVNVAVTALDSNAFCRLTVHQDFSKRQFAVFLNGVLLKQQQPFPNGGGSTYSSFRADCSDGPVYLDDVLVTTVVPGGLPSIARSIAYSGSAFAQGTVFTFR